MWRLQSGGRDLMAMPRVAFVRAIMLNHWYHHRGQLLVYLRLLNQSVPSVYGPTADENPSWDRCAGRLPQVSSAIEWRVLHAAASPTSCSPRNARHGSPGSARSGQHAVRSARDWSHPHARLTHLVEDLEP